ncbi:MAG: hypothetical protein M3T96_03320 [Acidobacteriota bacterium]|nr:hypothetical protein [Acidobacteriota bacterium]
MRIKSPHITKILDRTEFVRLSDAETAAIARHVKDCAKCRRAYLAAQIAAALLKEKSRTAPIAPAPFFPAKVLNAWRAQHRAPRPFAVLRRWWQTSATLLVLMLMTVGGLLTINLIDPPSEISATRTETSETEVFSTENAILNEKPARRLTTEQVFETLDKGY